MGNFSSQDPKLVDHKADLAIKLHRELQKVGFELVLFDYSRATLEPLYSACRVINIHRLPEASNENPCSFDFDHHAKYGKRFNSAMDQAKWKEGLVCYLKRVTASIESLEIQMILAWNAFSPQHQLIREYCDRTQKKIFFLETGIVPGSFEIDSHGSQCWSLPTRKPEWLNQFKPTSREITRVQDYVGMCLEKRISKKVDGLRAPELLDRRKYIFFAGTEVVSTAIEPVRNELSLAWSPHFSSEISALTEVADYANTHDLEVIYKRHPNLKTSAIDREKLPSNVALMSDTEIYDLIEHAQGTVTIASTVIAIASMMKSPSLLLGSNGLKHSGGCYQLDQKKDLFTVFDSMINRAPEDAIDQYSKLIHFLSRFTYRYGFSYSEAHEECFERGPDKSARLIAMLYNGIELENALL